MYTFHRDRGAVELPEHKLVFFAAPKVASSSIKKMMYELYYQKQFSPRNPDGSKYQIHRDFSGTSRFQEIPAGRYDGWTRITLVRDPVERIISAYTNRVVGLKILSEEKVDMELLKALKLKTDPRLLYFVRNIDKYRALSRSIWHHTDHFYEFLGHDLDYYHHVFKFDQLDKLTTFISEHTGKKAVLPEPTNRAKKKLGFDDLGYAAKQSILTYCAGDYALLKGYYSPPSLTA